MNTTRQEIRMLSDDIMDYVGQRFEKRFKEIKIDFKKELKKQKEEILIANQEIMERTIRETKSLFK